MVSRSRVGPYYAAARGCGVGVKRGSCWILSTRGVYLRFFSILGSVCLAERGGLVVPPHRVETKQLS